MSSFDMNPTPSPPNHLSPVHQGGFTLVELLACLAIIAALGALIALAVARAGAKADQVSCLSNLRQHGVSLAIFLSEKNSYSLLLNPGQHFPDHGVSLWHALSPHGLGPFPSDLWAPNSVYFCPSFIKQLKATSRLDSLGALYGYNLSHSEYLLTPYSTPSNGYSNA
jgi:prepilin-type N-terminal cleavage/methylation domain-containing protein